MNKIKMISFINLERLPGTVYVMKGLHPIFINKLKCMLIRFMHAILQYIDMCGVNCDHSSLTMLIAPQPPFGHPYMVKNQPAAARSASAPRRHLVPAPLI